MTDWNSVATKLIKLTGNQNWSIGKISSIDKKDTIYAISFVN